MPRPSRRKATSCFKTRIDLYEDFLRDSDAALRRSRGVWYTPRPVIRVIVRGVDALLRSEFSLKDGLADASRVVLPCRGVGGPPAAEVEERGGHRNAETEQDVGTRALPKP